MSLYSDFTDEQLKTMGITADDLKAGEVAAEKLILAMVSSGQIQTSKIALECGYNESDVVECIFQDLIRIRSLAAKAGREYAIQTKLTGS